MQILAFSTSSALLSVGNEHHRSFLQKPRVEYRGPHIDVTRRWLGTFGWSEGPDPKQHTPEALLTHFDARLQIPGEPRILREPLPNPTLPKREDPHKCTLYDRAPTEVLLMVADSCGFDWSKVQVRNQNFSRVGQS